MFVAPFTSCSGTLIDRSRYEIIIYIYRINVDSPSLPMISSIETERGLTDGLASVCETLKSQVPNYRFCVRFE